MTRKFNDIEPISDDFKSGDCFGATNKMPSDIFSSKDLYRSKASVEYMNLCTSPSHPDISSRTNMFIDEEKEKNTNVPSDVPYSIDKQTTFKSQLIDGIKSVSSPSYTPRISETIVSFEPTQITFFSGFDAAPEQVQKVPTQFRPIYADRLANCPKLKDDNFEPTDILKEAIQILQSLSSDISKSLEEIPKSIALPSVIQKYSRKNKTAQNDSFSFTRPFSLQDDSSSHIHNPSFDDISTFMSPGQEVVQLLAALQCRCLEYREVTKEIAEEITKECINGFSEDLAQNHNMNRIKTLISRYDIVRADFTSFKELCIKARGSRTGTESLGDLVTDCLQTSYLRLLVEENETFLVRLKFGIYMVRVNARLVRDLREASFRMQELEKEIDIITKCTIGYKV